ncbi:MAG: hypothetical protein MUE69_22000 [Myxococcota bacterium]|nr:hypothetical protein [Myxococcota bacterium]
MAHDRGDHVEALAGFVRASALTPSYDIARFNEACALAKLGRVDEAWGIVRTLLCVDLPSFAQRALHDPDLEAVRARHDVSGFVASVAGRYRETVRVGVPLVAYRAEPVPETGGFGGPLTAQAGVWLHSEGRFVPLSPSVRVDSGDAPIVAPLLDLPREQVVVVTTPGSGAEGDVGITTRLRLFSVPTGELLAEARVPGEPVVTEVGWGAGGVTVRVVDAQSSVGSPPRVYRLDRSGLVPTAASPTPTFVRVGPIGWWLRTETSTPRSSSRITLNGVPVFTHRSDDRRLHHGAWIDEARRVGLVLAADWGDCVAPDQYTLAVVDLAMGRVVREVRGRGQVHVMLGADGALYLQRGEELLRFADPRVDVSETLPSGLGITSRPIDVNPHC